MATSTIVVPSVEIDNYPPSIGAALRTVAAAALADVTDLTAASLASAAPADPSSSAAAVGVGSTAARADHKHRVIVATTSAEGLLSAADKVKLNSVQSGTGAFTAGVLAVTTGVIITATSYVVASHNTPAGTFAPTLKVAGADLVVGASGVGAFTVRALKVDGTAETSATGTVNWHIVG